MFSTLYGIWIYHLKWVFAKMLELIQRSWIRKYAISIIHRQLGNSQPRTSRAVLCQGKISLLDLILPILNVIAKTMRCLLMSNIESYFVSKSKVWKTKCLRVCVQTYLCTTQFIIVETLPKPSVTWNRLSVGCINAFPLCLFFYCVSLE